MAATTMVTLKSKSTSTKTTTIITTRMSLAILLILALISQTAEAADKTVKIFIIAGGDNAQGHASIPELHDLCFPPAGQQVQDPSTTNDNSTNPYHHLIDAVTGQWAVRNDVFVAYEKNRDAGLTHQPLPVKGFGKSPNQFGPDVEFGHVIGNTLDDPVVIVKAAWDKRTLYKDFRPPSANGLTGFQFLRIGSTVKQVLEHLGEIVGEEYRHATTEIVGLVWWHGYDDIRKEHTAMYEQNLGYFLRDIRQELELPWLPILVAELGGQGLSNVTQEELDFRAMQRRVVHSEEFNTTTKLVETAKFHVADEYRVADDYTHYFGRARTMIAIGRLMAIEMIELARLDRDARDAEGIEAEFENMEDNLGTFVKLFFGFGVAAFVLFVAVARGSLTKASLRKSWRDTLVAMRPQDDEDDSTGPSTEMKEGVTEEYLVV